MDTIDPLPPDQWVHIAVSLQGDTATLYVNGLERASQTMTIDPEDLAGTNNRLGRSQILTDRYFDGLLDEVYVYHKALSADQITTLARVPVAHFEFDNNLSYAPGRRAVSVHGSGYYSVHSLRRGMKLPGLYDELSTGWVERSSLMLGGDAQIDTHNSRIHD